MAAIGQWGPFPPLTGLTPMAALGPGQTVTITTPASTLATLYTDITGSTVAANPTTTDANGNLLFFAAPGQYYGQTPGGLLIGPLIVDEPASAVGQVGGPAGPLDGRGLVPASQLGLFQAFTAYTPTWTAAPGGTNPSAPQSLVGRYIVFGKLCFFYINLLFGSSTNGGAGIWQFQLPKTASSVVDQAVHAMGVAGGTAGGAQAFAGFAVIGHGSATLTPWLPSSISTPVCQPVQNANNANTPGTGVPTPTGGNNWPFISGSGLTVWGSYETV